MSNFQELTDFLDKYHVKYIIHSGCVEVEGDLCLNDKKLTSLPSVPRINETIEKDWCFIYGILSETTMSKLFYLEGK